MSIENNTIFTHVMKSPVGPLYMAVDKGGSVIRVDFTPPVNLPEHAHIEENRYACGALAFQLDGYFGGTLRRFDIDLSFHGTAFQTAVLKRLQKIPYGSTMTYSEVARKTGRKHAAQAVGRVVGMNPIRIIIPYHRVLPIGQGLGRYADLETETGHEIKRYLLELEGGGL